jgi:uncharacterized membrane protein
VTPESPASLSDRATLQRIALASYLLLILLTVLWEGWLAPKAPPGFWLTVKSLPLLLPLFGLLHGRPRSYVMASLLLLLYMIEGLVLLWTERRLGFAPGSALPWALIETLLALAFIVSASFYARGRVNTNP